MSWGSLSAGAPQSAATQATTFGQPGSEIATGHLDGVATFEDAPSFYKAPKGQSLYMGGAVGNGGYFDFKTFVQDKASGRTLAEINWSMMINIPVPGKGGSWWSFSDQK